MLRAISTVLSAPFYLPAAVNNRMPATTHLMTIHVIHVLLVSCCHTEDNLPSTATMNKVLLTNTGMKERKKFLLVVCNTDEYLDADSYVPLCKQT